jgi:hypothetical protein
MNQGVATDSNAQHVRHAPLKKVTRAQEKASVQPAILYRHLRCHLMSINLRICGFPVLADGEFRLAGLEIRSRDAHLRNGEDLVTIMRTGSEPRRFGMFIT